MTRLAAIPPSAVPASAAISASDHRAAINSPKINRSVGEAREQHAKRERGHEAGGNHTRRDAGDRRLIGDGRRAFGPHRLLPQQPVQIPPGLQQRWSEMARHPRLHPVEHADQGRGGGGDQRDVQQLRDEAGQQIHVATRVAMARRSLSRQRARSCCTRIGRGQQRQHRVQRSNEGGGAQLCRRVAEWHPRLAARRSHRTTPARAWPEPDGASARGRPKRWQAGPQQKSTRSQTSPTRCATRAAKSPWPPFVQPDAGNSARPGPTPSKPTSTASPSKTIGRDAASRPLPRNAVCAAGPARRRPPGAMPPVPPARQRDPPVS